MKKFIYFSVFVLLAACENPETKTAPIPTTNTTQVININQRVSLSGTLKYEAFYGAPGFGEDTINDSKEPTYILHLSKAIHFSDSSLEGSIDQSANTPKFETVESIQIGEIDGDEMNSALQKNKDKNIIIECTLYGAVDGHDHAPAITDKVFSIKEL